MKKKDSFTIVKEFLKENRIIIEPRHYLREYIIESDDIIALPSDIAMRIVGDAYGSSNPLVKEISEFLRKKHNLFLGRVQKEQLKKYIDYRFEQDFDIFVKLIQQDVEDDINLREICDKIIENANITVESELNVYLSNLKKAITDDNHKRILDYLIFLYSRLLSLNERRKLSLKDLFDENKKIIKKELNHEDYSYLERTFLDDSKKDRFQTIAKFNSEYIHILDQKEDHKDKSSIIYVNIGQELCDKFGAKEDLINYLLNVIKTAYYDLQNHKSLIIHIQNIFYNGIDIKWELYAYLTIFAEKFNAVVEDKPYYFPADICADVLEHKFGLSLTDADRNSLKTYYSKKFIKKYLTSVEKFNSEEVIETIEYFKRIYVGFTFIDCYILQTEDDKPSSKEIKFIQNQHELLLVFNKHEVDERKIPCPVCGSLKISGNSYPEVGIKSWECKNPLCSARSKTNRGKRYSARTILMQNATFDFSSENQIEKELTKVWRKDVVEKWSLEELYKMVIKYYSFVGDSITVLNPLDSDLFEKLALHEKREFRSISFSEFIDSNSVENLYENFYDTGDFCDKFLYHTEPKTKIGTNLDKIYINNKKPKFILGNCEAILKSIKQKSIHNMVTSPPYYNAREYSQWKNLYNYLNDMYKINLNSFSALIEGGVFFYNIGDIFDNENITVKSKMGEKRIPLGAYTILLFEKAGFQLLDNIIWYKGEPQSNRYKNDGNYTPYYQRPANCYEHMFIFKKPGKLHLNNNTNENLLTQNILRFIPVFKIGKGGVNRYGHTAPFPKKVPQLSTLCFTNEGEIVLDPFSGSGTSAITAVQNGRIGVGIELNKEYLELSVTKAKEEELESDVFL